MSALVLENLTKVYPNRVRAVDDLTLDVAGGELLVLMGPSGCGKTTTLRLIAGLEQPTGGTIRLGGRVANAWPPKDRDVAMVFQNYALYPHLTVRGNLSLGLTMRRVAKPEIERRVDEAAELLGIGPLLERRPHELSGGQRQRVALGRAIARRPAVFLFDEPLSQLDASSRLQMRREIRLLHARLGATMVYVTHDQTEAMTLGQRIAVLDAGRLQQVADPETLYRHPANRFVALHIGSPPMNLLAGRIEAHEGRLLCWLDASCGDLPNRQRESLPIPAAWADRVQRYVGRAIVLGIRPEHVGSPAAQSGPGLVRMAGMVEAVEPVGAESFVYFRIAGQSLLARMPTGHGLHVGQQAELAVAADQLFFFDPDSGRAA